MSKHTPGPWCWGTYHQLMVVPEINGRPDKHSPICVIPSDGFPHTEGAEYNACLIAAAPELLEALKYYSDTYCEGWCKEDGGTFEDCGGCKARAAIAKAEGKA